MESSSEQPPILAYYIRSDIGHKKGNQLFHHFQVAHPAILGMLTAAGPLIGQSGHPKPDRMASVRGVMPPLAATMDVMLTPIPDGREDQDSRPASSAGVDSCEGLVVHADGLTAAA